ncbi:DNA recombination protein RmuC [Geobacter sp. AOG1]|uniref:DNA recombination protein RmuC n=1 Tax=Geobacter sp. AOG1 TaxID=1566346 RepID=UPI001CC6B40B|nr:DNA recombination protein RmuC [Geobacter sp. AOG1]GFE58873.1 DNA recombination protein RmuC [Geobacter sp. AOG1]
MSASLLYLLITLVLIAIGLLLVLIARTSRNPADGLESRFDALERNQERIERMFRDELAQNRTESSTSSKQSREEQNNAFGAFSEAVLRRMAEGAENQKRQLDIFSGQLKTLTDHNIQKLDKINETVEKKLASLQEDNNRKLEQMRATVDEKLHDTLEKRLGESFKIVSERLEQVHKGLGEMQSLATGVGDLKKVLTNVKTRGTFGEIQLGSLLEQILTREQYEVNVATKQGSSGRVEFAIRLPGRSDEHDRAVWLPIDAKFPQEDYLRLVEAQEQGNPVLVEEASRQLERAIKEMARNIRDKYLDPPHTTDFGIMFLPTEGLYAEVLRRTGLFEQLQREFKVVVTGPTTLAALLNSLQMGFRTLVIEKRSSEVWTLLGAIKTEFATFGVVLDKTRKKLQEASNTIDSAATRSRVIERKLKSVQELPTAEAVRLLDLGEEPAEPDTSEQS